MYFARMIGVSSYMSHLKLKSWEVAPYILLTWYPYRKYAAKSESWVMNYNFIIRPPFAFLVKLYLIEHCDSHLKTSCTYVYIYLLSHCNTKLRCYVAGMSQAAPECFLLFLAPKKNPVCYEKIFFILNAVLLRRI